MTADLNIIATR